MTQPFFIGCKSGYGEFVLGSFFEEINDFIDQGFVIYKFPFPGAVQILGVNEDGTLKEIVHE